MSDSVKLFHSKELKTTCTKQQQTKTACSDLAAIRKLQKGNLYEKKSQTKGYLHKTFCKTKLAALKFIDVEPFKPDSCFEGCQYKCLTVLFTYFIPRYLH